MMRTLDEILERRSDIGRTMENLRKTRLEGGQIEVRDEMLLQQMAAYDELSFAMRHMQKFGAPQVVGFEFRRRASELGVQLFLCPEEDQIKRAVEEWAWILSTGAPPVIVDSVHVREVPKSDGV